jgi:hypothetical protein
MGPRAGGPSGFSGLRDDFEVVEKTKLHEPGPRDVRINALKWLNHPSFLPGDQILDSTASGLVMGRYSTGGLLSSD